MNEVDKLPFWKEYPDRDTEFVRVYPTKYGELSEDDIWILKDAAIYIHIPFCKKKCTSCPYTIGETDDINDYIDSQKKELQIYALEPYVQDMQIKNIYIGGGTPSCLEVGQIRELLDCIHSNFSISDKLEVSMEIIPKSYSKEELKELFDMNVNRISVGVQTFDEKELKELKRGYTLTQATQLLDDLKEIGFASVNIDLMCGIPGQTKESFIESIKQAIAIDIASISFYHFFLLEKSDLMAKAINGKMKMVDKEERNDWFNPAMEVLCNAGYTDVSSCGFEIYSGYSFAKEGGASAYYKDINVEDIEVIGVGACASGNLNSCWYYNIENVKAYINILKKDELPLKTGARIEMKDYLRRAVILGLKSGSLCREKYKDRFGVDFADLYSEIIEDLKKEELVELDDKELRLTRPKGYYYISNVCKKFYSDDDLKQPQYWGQTNIN